MSSAPPISAAAPPPIIPEPYAVPVSFERKTVPLPAETPTPTIVFPVTRLSSRVKVPPCTRTPPGNPVMVTPLTVNVSLE